VIVQTIKGDVKYRYINGLTVIRNVN